MKKCLFNKMFIELNYQLRFLKKSAQWRFLK